MTVIDSNTEALFAHPVTQIPEMRAADWHIWPIGLCAAVVTITPELAEKLLALNSTDNRNMQRSSIKAFVEDMQNEKWLCTHQGINFDAVGDMTDGQHRLTSQIEADKTCTMLVCVSLHLVGVRQPYDTGKRRTLLYITKRAPALTSALRTLRALEHGTESTMNVPLSPAASDAIYEAHSLELELIAKEVPAWHKLYGGIIAACAYCLPAVEDKQAVLKWATAVSIGEMIARGDPAFALRRWCQDNRRASGWEIAMAAMNALRYTIVGRPLQSIYTGVQGYKAFTTLRRRFDIPNTPPNTVIHSLQFDPGNNKKEDDDV